MTCSALSPVMADKPARTMPGHRGQCFMPLTDDASILGGIGVNFRRWGGRIGDAVGIRVGWVAKMCGCSVKAKNCRCGRESGVTFGMPANAPTTSDAESAVASDFGNMRGSADTFGS
jgi:hypothetical protein